MTLLVQKFGGTSLGSIERIKAVAQRIKSSKDKGDDLVIVVSAMGHHTDELSQRVPKAKHVDHFLQAEVNSHLRPRQQGLPLPLRTTGDS